MKRMTTRNSNGTVGIGDPLRPYNYQDLQGVLERLAAYEDTGMEPQEIEKIRQDGEAGFLKQTARRYGVAVDRIRELVEADRDGRCVVLPCKVGDKIYKLFCGGTVELEVERIVCWSRGRWKVNANTDKKYRDWKGFEIDFSDFGKTVFLTREAAVAALKGEQHEN